MADRRITGLGATLDCHHGLLGPGFLLVLVAVALVAAGCASAGRQAQRSAAAGDWDTAVEYYQRALQDNPDRAEYRISLERAMINASRGHIDAGRAYEEQEEL